MAVSVRFTNYVTHQIVKRRKNDTVYNNILQSVLNHIAIEQTSD